MTTLKAYEVHFGDHHEARAQVRRRLRLRGTRQPIDHPPSLRSAQGQTGSSNRIREQKTETAPVAPWGNSASWDG